MFFFEVASEHTFDLLYISKKPFKLASEHTSYLLLQLQHTRMYM